MSCDAWQVPNRVNCPIQKRNASRSLGCGYTCKFANSAATRLLSHKASQSLRLAPRSVVCLVGRSSLLNTRPPSSTRRCALFILCDSSLMVSVLRTETVAAELASLTCVSLPSLRAARAAARFWDWPLRCSWRSVFGSRGSSQDVPPHGPKGPAADTLGQLRASS